MPLPEFFGTLGVKRAAHLLRRATFGATKAQIDAFANLNPVQAIQQLYRQALPATPPPIDPDTLEPWVITGNTDPEKMEFEYIELFKRWFIGQMMSAGVPPALSLAYSAREKLVFFLHTHFTAIAEKINSSRALYYQNQLYRLYAIDLLLSPVVPYDKLNFKELTKKVSVDNAMLRLLDGNLNVNGSPNENYARELFELYSIGRGLENSLPPPTGQGDYILFTEQDVQQAARVLSGWNFDDSFSSIDPDTQLPRGIVRGSATNASSHDNGVKTFSNRFINPSTGQPWVIQPNPSLLNGGRATEQSALDEISQLIDMIYTQEETARHICRKIYRFFVYHKIDTTIENTIIAEMANTFRTNNFKLQPVVENLLRSQHFYDAAVGLSDDKYGGIIKSPLELITGTLKFFQISVPNMSSQPQQFYEFTGAINSTMENQGMIFYQPFDVAGYDAYHQFPIYNRAWITVNYLANRYAFIRSVVNVEGTGPFTVNVYNFVRSNINNALASNARNLVIELVRYLLPWADNLTFDPNADDNATITAERLNYFLRSFLSDIDPDPEAAWTTRWTNQIGIGTMTSQLQSLFNALMQSPEYQLQ
ncbi:MAG: DUF1800 domain-containing protein [Cyclobacteriaceae bacterium]|nr:DUF1800 domain-containing protein [Cyclobacteriaceae bacterium]MCX7636236.1 DUF1800 domain-containing protein [Cyclobacteriaceae bacterium]MDW8331727.1 DUF1800 family protein [Cyclobacteriaceae bacterium]